MSSKKQPEQQKFVIDEDLGKGFYKALSDSNLFDCRLFSDVWPSGTDDPVWIPLAAEQNLIVITRDGRIRLDHNDVAIPEGARIISIGSGKKPLEVAEWFIASQAIIERFVRKNEAPFFARFNTPTPKEIATKIRPKGKIRRQ